MFVENVQLPMPFTWGFKTKVERDYSISVHYQCSWTLSSIGRLHSVIKIWCQVSSCLRRRSRICWMVPTEKLFLFSVGLFDSKQFYWTNLLATYVKANHSVTTSSKPLCLNDTYVTHVISGPRTKEKKECTGVAKGLLEGLDCVHNTLP